ncbi:MAG TPA: segregation/condensation protein A [Candidatus Limnocylindria bacterium]|nr:segregation/condensation protein A [Candidatus Limnocylindria bacterium]
MPVGPRPPEVSVAGFEGPLDLLLELVEEKKLDVFTVRLGDLADEYLVRVRAMVTLPADEVSAFLAIASRLVLLKARSLLPSLVPISLDDESDTEEELRLRLIEYATTKGRAEALGDRLRAGERAFHREGGTVELPPRGGDPDALASAWLKVLALARRTEETVEVPGERYSVEQRTVEIETLIGERGRLTFATLLGDRPTLEYAIVTFIALLDLYRRVVIDITQDELFGEILIERKMQRMEGLPE